MGSDWGVGGTSLSWGVVTLGSFIGASCVIGLIAPTREAITAKTPSSSVNCLIVGEFWVKITTGFKWKWPAALVDSI